MNKSKKHIINIAFTAVFAALTAVITSQLKLYTGINGGYIHFGDGIIYLAACTLPLPYAAAAAAVGGAAADILAGAAVWAVPTAVIKALTTLPFSLVFTLKLTKKPQKMLSKATAFMPLVSGAVTVLGYLAAESVMYSFQTAVLSVFGSLVQAAASAAVYYAAAAALDKMNFKTRIYKSL